MEIILGKERRRWSDDEKRDIVSETYAPGAVILDVARRHQISSGQIHTWRKQLRAEMMASAPPARFVPLAMVADSPPPAPADARPMIEIDVGGAARIWITGAADAALVAVVLKALSRK